MKKIFLIIGLIVLAIAVEGGRIWYVENRQDQTEQFIQAQTQHKIDSLANREFREKESDLSTEWAARLEQDQALVNALKDSIQLLKAELTRARYGNLADLVTRLGEKGIRKREKRLVLPSSKMITESWADMRIFLDGSIPKKEITVKLTRPHKNTEIVTWKTGEVYYLKGQESENLLEVSVLGNTATQAVLSWRYYSGF